MSDSFFSAFKLQSNYTPNPTINSSSAPEITPSRYCICAHCPHLFSFNIHHLGYVEDQGTITSSTRWSPTPAQLLYLEELYRQGTKTPTAQQIQQIASQLRRFGKIEAKNVFYWFQNHKARERQKRRRCEKQISASSSQDHKQFHVMGLSSEKQSQQEAHQGMRGTGYEVKETKKWASTSNCSELAEVSDSLDMAAERGAYRRTQPEERETQILRSKREESQEAKSQNRDQMPCFPSNSNHLKNITTHHHTQTSNPTNYYDVEVADDRTLELFPHKRDEDEEEDGICVTEREDKFCSFKASVDSEITSNQFFEFLPLRN